MKQYALAGLLACVTACASDAGIGAVEEGSRTSQTYDRSASPVPPLSCPSQDFNEFLKKFADASFSYYREQYTAIPLEYVVPSHTLSDVGPDAPAMHLTLLKTPDRSLHFRYRYFRAQDSYAEVGLQEERFDRAALEAEMAKTPVSVQSVGNEGYDVTFGLESEVDIYRFERDRNCWYLARATNPRD